MKVDAKDSNHNIDKEKEKSIGLEWPKIKFVAQPMEEIMQLETITDQIGSTVVDHIYKRAREVYGQLSVDVKPVNWKEFGITDWVGRPSPYDFPAFEHERDVTTLTTVEGKKHDVKTKKTQSLENKTNNSKIDDEVPKSKKTKSQRNPPTANTQTAKVVTEEKKSNSKRSVPTMPTKTAEEKK